MFVARKYRVFMLLIVLQEVEIKYAISLVMFSISKAWSLGKAFNIIFSENMSVQNSVRTKTTTDLFWKNVSCAFPKLLMEFAVKQTALKAGIVKIVFTILTSINRPIVKISRLSLCVFRNEMKLFCLSSENAVVAKQSRLSLNSISAEKSSLKSKSALNLNNFNPLLDFRVVLSAS